MSHLLKDLCYAVYRLAQARSAAIIVLTLALGIGANKPMALHKEQIGLDFQQYHLLDDLTVAATSLQ